MQIAVPGYFAAWEIFIWKLKQNIFFLIQFWSVWELDQYFSSMKQAALAATLWS